MHAVDAAGQLDELVSSRIATAHLLFACCFFLGRVSLEITVDSTCFCISSYSAASRFTISGFCDETSCCSEGSFSRLKSDIAFVSSPVSTPGYWLGCACSKGARI